MDFVRIIRSLEEFLYEVMTWILFYPRTFLRAAFKPLRTLAYAEKELGDAVEQQYADSISPPLFLMQTLAISYAVELSSHIANEPQGGLVGAIMHSEQALLILRSLVYAVFPLSFAVAQLKRQGIELTRDTLRGPFFGQCYVAAIFSLAMGVATTFLREDGMTPVAGAALLVLGFGWYLSVQTRWFRERLQLGWLRAFGVTVVAFLRALILVIAVMLLIAEVPLPSAVK